MSRSKATSNTLAQSHIRMHNKLFKLIPVILSVVIIFTVISCGGGSSAPSTVPVANAGGPYVGNANQALAFNGSASTAPSGKSITSYAWIFGDGSSGTGASTSHIYTVAGNYTATLTVTDSSGATGSSNVAVQIITAPVSRPGGPYTGKVGTAVSFNGSASTAPPGQLLGFSWNFGDGSTGSGATPSHTYGSPCVCTVSLTVTDDTAGTSFATTTATIAAGPAPSGESATPSTFFAIGPAANSTSQFAYVLTTSASGATSLAIETIDNATGNLQGTDVTPPWFDSNFAPAGMITDPSRKFLYVYSGNSVLSFSIAPGTGALNSSGVTATNGSTDIPSNQALIFSPSGKFAFFITQDSDATDPTIAGSITRFSVDSNTGALGAIETISAEVSRAQSAAIDPAGKFLYISGFAPTSSTDITSAAPQIAIFAVTPGTGALTATSDSPLAIKSGIPATSVAINPTGRFMYASGEANGFAQLSVFSINATAGGLTQSVAPTQMGDPSIGDTGSGARSFALSQSGGFAYVLETVFREGSAQQAIQLFELNAQTGAPTDVTNIFKSTHVAWLSTFGNAGLMFFSPNQTSATTSSGDTDRADFLILIDSADAPLLVFSTDPKTGVPKSPAATDSAGH